MRESSVFVIGGSSWKICVLLLLLALMNLSDFGEGQVDLNIFRCMNTGNYTASSTYSANLNATLSALVSNMTEYGFYNASTGLGGTDGVNAVALCRVDIGLNQCRECVQTAAIELRQRCQNRKQAIRWYEYCTLHYSNQPINGSQATDIDGNQLINTANVRNPVQFRLDRTALIGALRAQAANGSSLVKAAAGRRNTIDSLELNALLQCIPTISLQECNDCLFEANQDLPRASEGARVLRSNCIIRYELYSFFSNETRLRQLNVLQSPQAPSPPPETSDNNASPNRDENTGETKDDDTPKVVIAIVVPIAACLLILGACAVFFLRRRSKKRLLEIPEPAEEISTVESLQYDFRRVTAATDDFADANKLGEGGFGAVYRGKLVNGLQIAVKRLARDSGQGENEFKNEVLLVAKLQHKNLVRLLGFSIEGTERLLIYEYVPNGSLDQIIFDPSKSSQLDWDRRHKIIGGIARGLLYLHEDSRLRIIHRDLKASNILLDGGMNPKIADFGMARLFRHDETQGNTSKIAGTYGYMSPEYALYGQFSVKSDVFSFGILILEIISGKKTIDGFGDNMEDLLAYTWKNWREGTAENVIDPVLRAGKGSVGDILRCIHIALLCVQEDPADRPTMNNILVMLSSSTVTLPVASRPAFTTVSRSGMDIQQKHNAEEWDTNSSNESNVAQPVPSVSSRNDMSISDFHPR